MSEWVALGPLLSQLPATAVRVVPERCNRPRFTLLSANGMRSSPALSADVDPHIRKCCRHSLRYNIHACVPATHLDGGRGQRRRAEEAEARRRPPHGLGVQAGEPLVLELVADDKELLRVRAGQRVEPAQAEEQVLEAVPGMLLRPPRGFIAQLR